MSPNLHGKGIPTFWKEKKRVKMALYHSPDYQISFESFGLSFKVKKFNIDFQGGGYGGHLGFPITIILAIFALQVPSILSMKFRVNWPFL